MLLTMAAAEVLGSALTEHEVGFRTILGAISVYLILGLLFSFAYAAIDRLQSGAFFGKSLQTGDYVFFSFTTLTTTGYGNLVPAGQPQVGIYELKSSQPFGERVELRAVT